MKTHLPQGEPLRVAVVGGGGYVGTVLVQELLAQGFAVRIIDRLLFGRQPIESLLDRVELVVADMRVLTEADLDSCSAVINLGGLSNEPTAEFAPRANHELNAVAALRIAELARRTGVKRYIYASSCSVYDPADPRDIDRSLMTEEVAVAPRASYSKSKLAAEQAIVPLAHADFAATVLRMGTVFGFSPRMRFDLVVNAFVRDAIKDGCLTVHSGGQLWRPLVGIHDAARAYVAILNSSAGSVSGQIFNVVSANYQVAEIASRVQHVLRSIAVDARIETDHSPGHTRSYRASGEKLTRALGFRPTETIADAVPAMVEDILAFGYLDFENPKYYNIEWFRSMQEEFEAGSRMHGQGVSRSFLDLPD